MVKRLSTGLVVLVIAVFGPISNGFILHSSSLANLSSNRIQTGQKSKTLSCSSDISLAESSPSEESSRKQTLSAATFNLVKACIGSGVLALPAGVAVMGDVPSLLLPSAAILSILGALSAYSFYMIGRLSHADGSKASTKSISEAWEAEVGKSSAWVVSLACLLTPLGSALTYSIILGDMLSSLATSIGLKGVMASRQVSILGITFGALIPLCNLKSLAALSPLSMVGVSGMLMTCIFMIYRALPGGAYSAGGALLGTIAPTMKPTFGVIGDSKLFSPAIFVLVSMASTAYLVHFSAHDFYDGLEESSLSRFGLLTIAGFVVTTVVNIIMMSFGFLTFGGNCQGMILNNYSAKDIGATLCRMIVTISLVGSYPLFMRGIKSAYFELFHRGKKVSDDLNKKATRMFLGALTSLALVLEDAGFMVSITGALMGSAIIYAMPSIIFLKNTSRRINEGTLTKTKQIAAERMFNRALIVLGGVFGVLGGSVTILNTFFPGKL